MKRNEMKIEFDSISDNEAFARVTVAAFMAQMNPSMEEVADVKTAVSEAVTNAIIHGYEGKVHKVTITGVIEDGFLCLEVADQGVGIKDVKKAMEPLYTSRPELAYWSVPVWDFCLWRPLWMRFKSLPNRGKERLSP